jgi:type 1 glutamine amidotransferase
MPNALIVWGGWPGHRPEECAAIVAEMLARDGFAVRRECDVSAFADPANQSLDLIVPIVTMAKIGREEVAALSRTIENGTGLAGFHGGMADAFRESPDYQFIVGGQFVAHPGGIIDYRVEVSRPDDPIMQGIASFAYRSEQYYMHVDPANEVLATTAFSAEHAPWIDGVAMPVVWKRRHGRGRVFYSSLGHAPEEFAVPEMRAILRRGMRWAARLDVDAPAGRR